MCDHISITSMYTCIVYIKAVTKPCFLSNEYRVTGNPFKDQKLKKSPQITVKEDHTDLCCHLMLSEEGVYIKKGKSFRNRVIEE